jgi:heterodisulfide reductase subunit B2
MSNLVDITYFPGCALESSAREAKLSLELAARILGLNLIELDDWNCCGSSSVNALDKDIGFSLAVRNLSLASPDRLLMTMCPLCVYYLRKAQLRLREDQEALRAQEQRWGRPVSPDLEVVHFMEVLVRLGPQRLQSRLAQPLKGLKAVPYYGCATFRGAPALSRERYYQGELGSVLAALGAKVPPNVITNLCCGSFLSTAHPEVTQPLVNKVMESAVVNGAECLVTSCAMCQLNLEMRCTLKEKLPIFHFSEILALAFGVREDEGWFPRHLTDPRPLLREKGLVS